MKLIQVNAEILRGPDKTIPSVNQDAGMREISMRALITALALGSLLATSAAWAEGEHTKKKGETGVQAPAATAPAVTPATTPGNGAPGNAGQSSNPDNNDAGKRSNKH